MGFTGTLLSFVSTVAGAILYWAVDVKERSVRYGAVGVILMVAGAAGFVVSTTVVGFSRRKVSPYHVVDRQFTDDLGHESSVHEQFN